MANTSIAADIHQPLYIHCNFRPQVTFDFRHAVDGFSQLIDALKETYGVDFDFAKISDFSIFYPKNENGG